MSVDPEKSREYQRKYAKEKRRGAGKCVSGPEPALPGKTRCQFHTDAFNASLKAKRDARAKAGLCPLCPEKDVRPCAPGKKLCQLHLDKQKERDDRRRLA